MRCFRPLFLGGNLIRKYEKLEIQKMTQYLRDYVVELAHDKSGSFLNPFPALFPAHFFIDLVTFDNIIQ